MGLDDELESMEESGLTEAEGIDEEADLDEQFDDDMLHDDTPGQGRGDDEEESFLTRENLDSTKEDLNEIYKESAAAARELKEAFDDIKSGLNLGSLSSLFK